MAIITKSTVDAHLIRRMAVRMSPVTWFIGTVSCVGSGPERRRLGDACGHGRLGAFLAWLIYHALNRRNNRAGWLIFDDCCAHYRFAVVEPG